MAWKRINHLCCYIMLLWAYLPVLAVYQSSLFFQIPFLCAMGLWILTALQQMTAKSRQACIILMGSYMLIMYLYVILKYGNLTVLVSFRYILLFAFGVNGIYYIEQPDRSFAKKILLVSVSLIILTAITTFLVLMVDGNAARTLTSSSSSQALTLAYKKLNVCSYGFIYGVVIIIPMLIFYSLPQKKLVINALIWSIIVFFTSVVIMSNFTTALMLLFVDFVLVLLIGRGQKSNFSFLISLVILVFVVPTIFVLFLNFMSQMSESIYAQSKLESILGIISGQKSYASATSRHDLFMISLNSFSESPLWGIGAWYGSGSPYIGQHAQFIDDLARYGLLGFIPLIGFVLYGMKSIYNASYGKHFYNKKVLISIIIFLALGFMNPIYDSDLLASVFIVVPMLDKMCYE